MENALITGATKGIGRSIATKFVREGINVAVCSRNGDDLEAFKSELLQINPGVKVYIAVADGSVKTELLQFAAAAEGALGFISILVNNLGQYQYGGILNDGEGAFEEMLNTNLAPAYHLYRYLGPKMMAKRKGHIFNICSVVSLHPIADAGLYSITKVALYGLNQVMRQELQPHGVKVTAVIPGSTLTESWIGETVNKNDMVLPEDIASAIVNIQQMSAGANVDEIIIKPLKGQL